MTPDEQAREELITLRAMIAAQPITGHSLMWLGMIDRIDHLLRGERIPEATLTRIDANG